MPIVHADVWIRAAGHAARIRAGEDFHWRCFVNRALPEIPLRDLNIGGTATKANFILGTDPLKSNELGLNAWFDFYGDVSIRDGIATIALKTPPADR